MIAAAPNENALERQVRTLARRHGLTLRKARRRNVEALDYGRYWLVDKDDHIAAGHRWGLSLPEVIESLTEA